MSPFQSVKYIAFDLDGTLVDSVPDLAHALRLMLADIGVPSVSDAMVRGWIGNGVEIMVKRALSGNVDIDPLLSPELIAQALARFEFHYRQNASSETTAYPNVYNTLASLKQAGFLLGIVTNKAQQFVPAILQQLQLEAFFNDIIGGDTLSTNKPHPQGLLFLQEKHKLKSQEIVMVGDSKNDILAAKNAHIASIGLTYGYNYGEPIADSHPDAVVDDFAALLTIFNRK
ncbi:MAG: phosphoglycolate phosphatase [Vibrionaceae bacterium]